MNARKSNKVSVIIPAYNVEQYVENCYESIKKQTYSNLEILIIEDGSTDKTKEICDRIALFDDRVIVIHKANGGLSDARNVGLDHANGEYIVFIDADDSIHPKYIEILLDGLIDNECDISQCEFFCTNDTKEHYIDQMSISYEVMTGKQATLLCSGEECIEYIVVTNKLYKKELFEDIRFPVGKIYEDQFTTWKLFWKAEKIVYVHALLYCYYQRMDSITGTGFSRRNLQVVEAYVERSRFLKEQGQAKEALYMIRWAYESLKRGIAELRSQGEKVDDLIDQTNELEIELQKREDDYYKVSFQRIQKARNVAIYGAGVVGMSVYRQIKQHFPDINTFMVDRYSIRGRELVKSIDHLLDNPDTLVVIAVEKDSIKDAIRKMLYRIGITDNNIIEASCVI